MKSCHSKMEVETKMNKMEDFHDKVISLPIYRKNSFARGVHFSPSINIYMCIYPEIPFKRPCNNAIK